jgi:hypothetical protein
MLNRATFIGLAIALGSALLVAVLVDLAIGPRASQADLRSASISIEDIHRKVDHTRLPLQSVPEP